MEQQDKNRVIAEALEPSPEWVPTSYERCKESTLRLWSWLHGHDPENEEFHEDPVAMVALKEACWKVRGWKVETARLDPTQWYARVFKGCDSQICSVNAADEMLAVRDAVYQALDFDEDGEACARDEGKDVVF